MMIWNDRKAHLRLLSIFVLVISALTALQGCHGSSTESPPIPKIREIFIALPSLNRVSVFDATSSGNPSPLRSFGNLTGMYLPTYTAVDSVNNEIYVVNAASITVYPRTATGNVAPVRVISGPDTQLGQPYGLAIDAVHDEIFVLSRNHGIIVVFARTAVGNVPPKRMIDAKIGDIYPAGSLAIDVTNNEIYVAMNDGSIVVHARTAEGVAAPVRIVAGSETGLSDGHLAAICIDTVHNEILVLAGYDISASTETYAVLVYPRTAQGNVPPLRSISLPANVSVMYSLRTMAVDAATNEIFIANVWTNSVFVFPRMADGTTPPVRSITGPATGLNSPMISLDALHGELVALNYEHGGGRITTYPQTASGDTAPLRTISGTPSGITDLRGIALDSINDEVFVINPDSITAYPAGASGDVPPLRRISGEATTLRYASAIAVDAFNNELFVLQGNSVLVYSRTAGGDSAPLRTLSGPSTGLLMPRGLVVDAVHNELLVGDMNTIYVYARKATGDVPPLRSITGPATNIGFITDITVDTRSDEITVTSVSDYRRTQPYLDSVLTFPRSASGNTVPLRMLSGSSVGLWGPLGLAVDAVNDELFVAGIIDKGVNVYARKAAGDVAPLRSIATEAHPSDIALGTQ